MPKKISFLSALFLMLLYLPVKGQIPINDWRCHLSYNNGLSLAETKDKIYCATRTGMFYYNLKDNSVSGVCTVDGFSDIYVNTMYFDEVNNLLFIAYKGGNMDIVKSNSIKNVNNFANSPIPGSKEINNFYSYNGICYISSTVGILEYRLKKEEFGDHFRYIGPTGQEVNINAVTITQDSMFAASSFGIQVASIKASFLGNYKEWKWISKDTCTQLVNFTGKTWASFTDGTVKYWENGSWKLAYTTQPKGVQSMSVNHKKLLIAGENGIKLFNEDLSYKEYPSDNQTMAIYAQDGNLWISTKVYPLIRISLPSLKYDFYGVMAPKGENATHLTSSGNTIWVAPGSINDFGGANFNNQGFYEFKDNHWNNYGSDNIANWSEDIRDVMTVRKDPLNSHLWISMLNKGVAELVDNKIVNLYSVQNTNGILQPDENYPTSNSAPVVGLAFDSSFNLWMSLFRAKNQLAVRTPTGKWYSFDLGDHNWATDLVADDYNQVWLINHPAKAGMYVYNYGDRIESTQDDKTKLLTSAEGNGALPTNIVYSIAKDLEGQIWVGTSDGVAVFSDPSSVFNTYGYKFDATRPWVKSENNSGYLLMGESILCIAVDGANRKWFGTHKGVWLTSDDGTKIIAHFNKDNSPLLSNDVNSITVNELTGEVFFATDKGLISFKSTATKGSDKHENVFAYPNPVKANYDGPIAIRGLVRDAKVKITDITGNLVYETIAQGGQAIWYGKNFSGVQARSGVYLVFSTNDDGTETIVTKIMVIR